MIANLTTSPSGSRGFTIIEVLMAMLIMTVGLLGLLQSVNVAYEHSLRNKLREEAVSLAEEQLNYMRTKAEKLEEPETLTVTRPIGGVSKDFTVTRGNDDIGANSLRLKVAVEWRYKNDLKTHEIYTIKKR